VLAGGAGGLLVLASEFAPLMRVNVGTTVISSVAGHDQHGFGLLLIAAAALLMVVGIARGGSRPAAAAALALGVITMLIAVVGDLPDTRQTGVVGERYEQASAAPGAGFYLETLGATLLIVAGAGTLLLGGGRARPPALD
jgi:hypothetical protein